MSTYCPILKWKKGEICALQKLQDQNHYISPIIELIDYESPEDFYYTLGKLYQYPIYLDTINLSEDRKIIIDYLCSEVKNVNVIPILYYEDIQEDFLGEIAKYTKNLCIKLSLPEDMETPFLKSLPIINNFKDKYNFSIELLLDAEEIIDKQTQNIVYAAIKNLFQSQIELIQKFDNIIFCATSLPVQLSIEAGNEQLFYRYDFSIFKTLIEENPHQIRLKYADYGVTKFTETEIDFSKLQYGILPKIKYTTDQNYIVLKGKKNHSTQKMEVSYIDLSKKIANSDYFSGKDFSFGDNQIYDKATNPLAGPGSNQNWVTITTTHHIRKVIYNLSNLSST